MECHIINDFHSHFLPNIFIVFLIRHSISCDFSGQRQHSNVHFVFGYFVNIPHLVRIKCLYSTLDPYFKLFRHSSFMICVRTVSRLSQNQLHHRCRQSELCKIKCMEPILLMHTFSFGNLIIIIIIVNNIVFVINLTCHTYAQILHS